MLVFFEFGGGEVRQTLSGISKRFGKRCLEKNNPKCTAFSKN